MPPKKDDKKAPPPSANWHPVEIIVVLLFLASAGAALVVNISNYIANNDISFYGIHFSSVKSFISDYGIFFRIFSYVFSAACFIGIYILGNKAGEIIDIQKKELFPRGEPSVEKEVSELYDPVKEKWKQVVEHVESDIESNWRLAVIEADIILDELLDRLSLPGATIGDKLKSAEKSDFTTLDLAWEAHKIRNSIAHSGSDFLFNQREARRAISLYESVFKEFYLV